jgi:outer membrane protein assembly factor BamB
MRLSFVLLSPAFVILAAASFAFAQSPLFQRVCNSNDQKIYDSKSWSFNTGSPVRATILVDKGFLYFGNAGGTFYCIDKKKGSLKWTFRAGRPIHSSAISWEGKIYFTDNGQVLYTLDEKSGKLLWKFGFGAKKEYPWRYDYYFSSPVLHSGKLFVGGDDGNFYSIDPRSGKMLWKFSCKGIVRSTGAVEGNSIFFGDTEATVYSVDVATGKEQWQFHINGDTLKNENFGFDRRAITSSPVVVGEKVIFGARDGYLYCINRSNGQSLWKVDHRVSWIISTVAVKDSFVVTGTSDGRFVQAINLHSGKEIWKFRTALAVWASPLIVNDKVYAAGFDGQLTCIELKTGKRVSQFKTDGMMMSSPVWNDGLLYVGSDDGNVYAFSGRNDNRIHKEQQERFVFYEPGINVYYRNGADLHIKNYLVGNGYRMINSDTLTTLLSQSSSSKTVIVFASCYFTPGIISNGKEALLRKFLEKGGRIVLTGINPIVYKIDEKTKNPFDFNRHMADTVFGLDYGMGDTRSFMGQYPSFVTDNGKQLGLPDYWVTGLFIDEKNVDVVLGKSENGQASAFIKKYGNGGQLVQLWMDNEKPSRLDAIIKAAEWEIN